MTREEQIQDACDAYYDETWDEHGGKAMVVDDCHDIWFPSQATDDFFKAGAEWADKHLDITIVSLLAFEEAEKDTIKRACEWLKKHLSDYWSQKITDTDEFLEEFKSAMK